MVNCGGAGALVAARTLERGSRTAMEVIAAINLI